MIHVGDCLEVMTGMEAESVDAIVTDPPYGLSFMGKDWDHGVPGEAFWREALRVAKPGTYLLAFGGSRTYHRLTVAIEDAGWEVRDCIMWVYGSGFPKSLDVSKAIDKATGAEREVTGQMGKCGMATAAENYEGNNKWSGLRRDNPATDAARQWQGWETALKPAYEPIVLARKPLCGTVAENVLTHGTGALNIDGCRVGTGDDKGIWPLTERRHKDVAYTLSPTLTDTTKGRWPANFIHDGSDEVTGLMSEAARFFYCAKASKADRDGGCEGFVKRKVELDLPQGGITSGNGNRVAERKNHHPTVKPNSLMRYLCRLVTPPGGIVLDPFCGSGSTGKAAIMEGFRFVGIELNPEYAAIAQARIDADKPFVEQMENENEPRQLCLIYP